MPYQGNRPAENYTKRDYQDFTGGSGQTFTLNKAVAATHDLTVVVNNVVQDPADYSVNGTSLTLGGSVSATDDFYVVFNGPSTQSVTHPSDQALQATTIDADSVDTPSLVNAGDVSLKTNGQTNRTHSFNFNEGGGEMHLRDSSGNSGGFLDYGSAFGTRVLNGAATGNMEIGQAAVNTTGSVKLMGAGYVERASIDSYGSFNLNNQPMAGGLPTQQDPIWKNGPFIIRLSPNLTNVGNNVNSHTYTCPVAGKYLVSASFLIGPASGQSSWYFQLHKNNVSVAYTHGTTYGSTGFTQILTMAANDTIRFYLSQGRVYTSNHGMWCIAKIG